MRTTPIIDLRQNNNYQYTFIYTMFKKYKNTLFIVGITMLVYFLNVLPLSKPLLLPLALFSIIGLVGYGYRQKKVGAPVGRTPGFIYLLTAAILLVVAATGWFFSPFFFALYLLALLLAFEFESAASIGFIGVLAVLFSLNVGEVDIAYDFLVILSLVSFIPLTFYLRKEFLKLKEAEKEILVLRKTASTPPSGIVEDILLNKIHNFSANLRQPINDIKQLTHHLVNHDSKTEREKLQSRVIACSEEALRSLKRFEDETTGTVSTVTSNKTQAA